MQRGVSNERIMKKESIINLSVGVDNIQPVLFDKRYFIVIALVLSFTFFVTTNIGKAYLNTVAYRLPSNFLNVKIVGMSHVEIIFYPN